VLVVECTAPLNSSKEDILNKVARLLVECIGLVDCGARAGRCICRRSRELL
jgi:hypothetical protein